jgi:hypothetical protein
MQWSDDCRGPIAGGDGLLALGISLPPIVSFVPFSLSCTHTSTDALYSHLCLALCNRGVDVGGMYLIDDRADVEAAAGVFTASRLVESSKHR